MFGYGDDCTRDDIGGNLGGECRCARCASETPQTSVPGGFPWEPAVVTSVPHPDSVVCPCNGGGPGPCPYLSPWVVPPVDVPLSPWYVPTVAPTFGPLRMAWTCPRCNTVNAPHVDRCTCVPGTYTSSTTIIAK